MSVLYGTAKNELEIAKLFLLKYLTDPAYASADGIRASALIKTGQASRGLTKTALKTARRELGVESHKVNGEWFWNLPKRSD